MPSTSARRESGASDWRVCYCACGAALCCLFPTIPRASRITAYENPSWSPGRLNPPTQVLQQRTKSSAHSVFSLSLASKSLSFLISSLRTFLCSLFTLPFHFTKLKGLLLCGMQFHKVFEWQWLVAEIRIFLPPFHLRFLWSRFLKRTTLTDVTQEVTNLIAEKKILILFCSVLWDCFDFANLETCKTSKKFSKKKKRCEVDFKQRAKNEKKKKLGHWQMMILNVYFHMRLWVVSLPPCSSWNRLMSCWPLLHMQIAFAQGRVHADERISHRSYSKYTDLRGWFFRVG